MEYVRGACFSFALWTGRHDHNSPVGTSQEGADTATIKQIALLCKILEQIFIISAIRDIRNGSTGKYVITAYSIAVRRVKAYLSQNGFIGKPLMYSAEKTDAIVFKQGED